jgi:hypothetical protein
MGKASVEISGCKISSVAGFAIWVKHCSKITIRDCEIGPAGRTGIAGFNSAEITVESSRVFDCMVNGICLRGDTQTVLDSVDVSSIANKSVFVYQNGRLQMKNCTVEGKVEVEEDAILFPN